MKAKGIKNIIEDNLPWNYKPILTSQEIETLKSASSVVLAILAATGTVTLAAAAPNLIGALGKFSKRKRSRIADSPMEKQVAETLYYLKRSGKIQISLNKGDFLISLTNFGKKKAAALSLEGLFIPKPKSWKGRWWLVAADIPTKGHRHAADALRNKLKELSFYPLQRTLWLYPHDPRKELDFLLHLYQIQNFVTLMEVSRLDKEDEKTATKHFKSLHTF